MGTNWLSLSLPFFGLVCFAYRFMLTCIWLVVVREAVLHHRQRLNPVYGKLNWKHRDSDEMLASITAGSVVGGSLAYYTRGSLAVIGGGIMFGTLSAVAQFAFTQFRHARQDAAYAIKKGEQTESSKTLDLRNPPAREVDSFDDHGYDPLREFTQWVQKTIINKVGGVAVVDGGWVSPMLNALDLDYRKRLNVKIEILERQVASLRTQLEAKGIVVDTK
ncbi:UNVERIFIED_CONTAM: hypothetical protein HDU68_012183 [Siphonaria sp. JEL0065]|nr:hypothetical protein HDU68_012183 [Siphonaria sp. JEL0065]